VTIGAPTSRGRGCPYHSGETLMSAASSDEERIPIMQRILDNPFLLLFLGVVIPTVFYIVWGVMEIVQIPITQ
jgi:hypothetical protein